MNIGNVLMTQDRVPSRHCPSSVHDRLPEGLFVCEDRIVHQPRAHTAQGASSMAGLAIVLENTGSSGRNPRERTFNYSYRLLREWFRLPQFTVERR